MQGTVTTTLIILSLIIFTYLAFTHPKRAVALTVFALPLYLIRFSLFGIPLTFLECMILITFAAMCIQQKGKLHAESWKIPIIIFFLASVIALAVTPDIRAGFGLWKAYIIEPILFFLVIINTFNKNEMPLLWIPLGISGITIGAAALAQYFGAWQIPAPWDSEIDRRATSLYEFPNAVGLYLAPITAFFIARLILNKELRVFSIFVIICGIVGMLVSKTEGALAAVFIAAVAAAGFTRYKKYAFAVFALLTIIAFLIPTTRNIITFQDVSGDVRLALWQGTTRLLRDRPLQGAGLGGFPQVYDQYRLPKHVELLQYPHNIFLDFWVELGLLGLIWLIMTLALYFKKGIRHNSPEAKILIITMIAILIYGLVDVTYFKNDLSALFWLFLAMISVITGQK